MSTETAATPTPPPATAGRVESVDAYRGFVMLLMLAEVLRLPAVARALPESAVWQFFGRQQSHVEWVGCTLHDLIQPSFSFLVGVSLPFSLAARAARGQSRWSMALHAVWRSVVLIWLGIFLRSIGGKQTNYTFEDTLTQIGLGYAFLFALGLRPVRDQWLAFAAILIGYWALFALWSPGPDFDRAAVGVPAAWQDEHGLTGFAAHWDKNANPAWAFDTWFLNLFPRPKEFAHNGGGYATLSFIPTLATMILGLIAGGVLKEGRRPWGKVAWLTAAGVVALAAGWGLGESGVCPVVKRIWTPSWVLFSGGWCFLFLAGFYAVIDAAGLRGWDYPLAVIGANSIAAYCMEHLFSGFIRDALRRHFGPDTFKVLGDAYEPLLLGAGVLLVLWLILFWMYRRKVFIRI